MKGLRLEVLCSDHFAELYRQQQDPESRWNAAFMPAEVTDLESYTNRWTRFLADDTIVSRTIWLDDVLVGSVGKYEIEGKAELTYWIDRAYHGRGIATQACTLFLKEMTERPLHARAAMDNSGSVRVLEKLGFERTGTDKGFSHVRNAEVEEVVMVLL